MLADRFDMEEVAVGDGAAGLSGRDMVVVLAGDYQVAGVGAGDVAELSGGAGLELASVEQVALDAAGQLAAFASFVGGEQHVGAVRVLGEVGLAG